MGLVSGSSTPSSSAAFRKLRSEFLSPGPRGRLASGNRRSTSSASLVMVGGASAARAAQSGPPSPRLSRTAWATRAWLGESTSVSEYSPGAGGAVRGLSAGKGGTLGASSDGVADRLHWV
eukprot:4387795-Pyramimonas_sp.AAC.1